MIFIYRQRTNKQIRSSSLLVAQIGHTYWHITLDPELPFLYFIISWARATLDINLRSAIFKVDYQTLVLVCEIFLIVLKQKFMESGTLQLNNLRLWVRVCVVTRCFICSWWLYLMSYSEFVCHLPSTNDASSALNFGSYFIFRVVRGIKYKEIF